MKAARADQLMPVGRGVNSEFTSNCPTSGEWFEEHAVLAQLVFHNDDDNGDTL